MKKRKKHSFNFPPLLPFILILSICLNLYFLLSPALQFGARQDLSLQELQEIREPGIYGPSDTEIVEGSLYISVPEVKLQNTRINGDLFLTAGIGDGSVELVRVTVKDTAMVEGGGEDTVVFEDAVINHLVINREEGKVRVVLKGDTVVEKVTIKGEASLSTAGLSEEGLVRELDIETAADTELEGFYSLVNVAIKEARVTLVKGQVEKLCTGQEADEASITLKEGAVIDLLAAGAPLALAGEGLVKEVIVETPGLFKLSGNVEKVLAGGRGIFLEFGTGNTGTLLVKASEGTVMVHLAAEAVIKNIELDGAAGITGSGSIERVKINKPGTTIEQKPGTVELAEGIKAEVAGKELTGEQEKPEPSESPSKPSTPTVNLSAISNRVIGPGQSATFSLTVSPGDASISVSSSNTGIAGVSLSGRNLTIKGGNVAGTATITVRASKSGYNSRTRTFKVTVDPIREFIVEDGISIGYVLVKVSLRYDDWKTASHKYKVTVGGTTLKPPTSEIPYFYGEVLKEHVSRGNVKVIKN